MKNSISKLKGIVLVQVILLAFSVQLLAQETKIQIETKKIDAAVYSANGFLGQTKFNESINFNIKKELFVVGENELFETVHEEDFRNTQKINITPFSITSLNGKHESIDLGQVQILTEKLDPSLPNAYAHNAIYDEDLLNEALKEFEKNHNIFDGSEENAYILTGVVEKDIVFWDGYFPNKHKCIFVDVKWTLRDQKNRTVLFEKTVKGGHYYGKKFIPKNQAENVETAAYTYRKAVISSLVQFLRLEEMATKKYELQIVSENDIEEALTILTGTNFCSEISKCAEASVTVQTEKRSGSGFFISNNGYLLTNYHVIENEKHPTVVLSGGISLPAEVIRSNEEHDVALLKVGINSVTAIKISENGEVTKGEDVFAIGSPKGVALSQTTSRGIVSSYRESEKAMIQTDVSVNSGNSGGPLLNTDNKVIGIVTAKLKEEGVEGIAFAIPIKQALAALNLKLE